MNKVINGKRYNTETAKEMGKTGEYYHNDINSWEETLYRTKSGQYFIYGEGGANTRYAEPAQLGNWVSGEQIIPISEDKAKEWVNEYLSGEDYDRIFGEPEEKPYIATTITTEMKNRIDKCAKRESKKTSEIIREALEMYLQERSI